MLVSFNVQSYHCTYNTVTYIHGAIPLVLSSPCWPLCSPFVSPSLPPCVPFYLLGTLQLWQESSTSVSGCLYTDPICPTLHPTIPRPPNSQTPTVQRQTTTTSGIFRLLLSGTIIVIIDIIIIILMSIVTVFIVVVIIKVIITVIIIIKIPLSSYTYTVIIIAIRIVFIKY